MKFTREEQRYEYSLNDKSVVLDIGAFKGEWTREIHRRYGCRIHAFEPVFFRETREAFKSLPDTVTLYTMAVGGKARYENFGVQGDMTGRFSGSQERFGVPVIEVGELWAKLGLSKVDLMKLNVEGMEIEIIDALCDTGLINNVERLQVQFHASIPNCASEIERVKERLAQTHAVEWGEEDLVWTSYVRVSKFKSHSQAGQDKFVFAVTNGRPGKFLDIGSMHPVSISNTYGLELIGWTGVCVDHNPEYASQYKKHRSAKFLVADALNVNWLEHCGNYVDYLSLDIDEGTLPCLKTIPLDKIKFGVITIEHDAYRFGPEKRSEMRSILAGAGYVLIASNVCDMLCQFEDWWVSSEYVDAASQFRCENKDWREIVGQ